MSALFLNSESAAFDYVQTTLENEIPELSGQEKMVFDSLAKFGSPPGAESFGLPERLSIWLYENYQKASQTNSDYNPTTKLTAERLELANNLRFIAGKLERGEALPNRDDLVAVPLEVKKMQLNKTFFGQESTGATFVAGDLDENRLRNFAEFLEKGNVYYRGDRGSLSKIAPLEGSLGQERSLAVARNLSSFILLQKYKKENGLKTAPIEVKVIDEERGKAIEINGNNKEAVLEFGDPYRRDQLFLKMWSKDSGDLIVDLTYHKKKQTLVSARTRRKPTIGQGFFFLE